MKHKISKLAVKEIKERHDMLNKSHPLSKYKANICKNKKKNVRCILTLMLGSLFLPIDTRYNFCEKFSSVILSVSLFSQLWLGLIDCVILMKEYVSLTTAAMKMGERHFYSYHSKIC